MTKEEFRKDKCARLAGLAIEQAFLLTKLKFSNNPVEIIHLRLNIDIIEARKIQVIAEVYPPNFPEGGIVCYPCQTNEVIISHTQTGEIIKGLNEDDLMIKENDKEITKQEFEDKLNIKLKLSGDEI